MSIICMNMHLLRPPAAAPVQTCSTRHNKNSDVFSFVVVWHVCPLPPVQSISLTLSHRHANQSLHQTYTPS